MGCMTNIGKCLSMDSCAISEQFRKQFSPHYINLTDLLVRESFSGALPECNKCILVIDVDKWEIERAGKERRNLRPTMDFVCLLTSKKFLLSDAKFNVETNKINSSFIHDVKAKYEHTKPLFYQYLPVHDTDVLLFQSRKTEVCRNRIRKLQNNKPGIEVMDVFEFYEKFII